ncbi:hypothetical protein GMDG_03243 [Pseudogymnoascus destructans 20631-21]|uniref:lytic cellulose monooxygenase (C4-dehydrogenating) n=1 Tax=Pseudogymnoascus destructans (strain ATCC MYA-4855 / 20631-21) TaxID=658429 RepID=L8G7B8_PSED2|nr:hypothetical protein GMDG_03243 [Pseudogymnoascus destructans 20631-21]
MKSVVLLELAGAASAHYTFPALISVGTTSADWEYVRDWTGSYTYNPVQDVSSLNVRCNVDGSTNSASTLSVAAGSEIGFTASSNIYHPGPVLAYLAKVPFGQTAATWDGSGDENGPSGLAASTAGFTILAATPNGDYLLRVERIGLHVAQSSGAAQFYLSCVQITVTGGGSGTPGPLIAFPGAYSASDPGILININYPVPTSYTPPGCKEGHHVSPREAPLVGPVGLAPRTTSVEASHSTAGQDESMASKLADLRKRMDEERAYINTMEEALELLRRMHGDDYNAYPEAVRDFAKKQARIQEENRRKRRHQDIKDEWEGPQQEEEAETASTVSMEVTPAQRPIGRVKEPKVYKGESIRELNEFMASIRATFRYQPRVFPTEQSKVAFAAKYLEGHPMKEWDNRCATQGEGYIDPLDIAGFEEFLRDLHVDPV